MRALVALVVLAVLVGGVPWALLEWFGAPLSGLSGEGAGDDLTTALLSDSGLLALLGLALWLAWGLLVLSVLAEVVAQARGVGRPRVSFGGPVQKLASFLVGSILFGLATPGLASAEAPSSSSTAGVPVPVPAAQLEIGGSGHDLGQTMQGDLAFVQDENAGDQVGTEDLETITVGRSDTVWTLAEEYLGDASRWREIWELNRDVEQADGSVWANAEDGIQAGWRLRLPQDAETGEPSVTAEQAAVGAGSANASDGPGGADAGPDGGATGAGPGEVTVQPGDHFWALAEQQLSAAWGRAPSDAEIAPYWQEMVEANTERLLPPEDPDLIYPDQVFTSPGVPADPTAPPPAAPPPAADTGSGAGDQQVEDTVDEPTAEAGDGSAVEDDAGEDDEAQDDDAAAGQETADGGEDENAEGDEVGDDGSPVSWDDVVSEDLASRLPDTWQRLLVDDHAQGWNGLTEEETEAMEDLDLALQDLDEASRDELIASITPEEASESSASSGDGAEPSDEGAETPTGNDGASRDDDPGDATEGADDADEGDEAGSAVPDPGEGSDGSASGPAEGSGDPVPDSAEGSDGSASDSAEGSDSGQMLPGSGGNGDGSAPDPGEGSDGTAPDPGTGSGTGDNGQADLEVDPVAPAEAAEEQVPGDVTSSIREEESGSRSLVPIGLVAGGLGLAGALLLLDRRRRAQQRHRRKGHDIRMPDPAEEQRERELRHGADVDGAQLLDAALRAAAAGSGSTGLPPLRWVEADDDEVVLMMEAPAPAPPGFRSVSADRWATVASPAELEMMGSSASPPLPSLLPFAATSEGREVLVDLEAAGVVVLDGDPSDVEGLLRATAAAAATVPWSEQTRVLLVAMDGQLTELPWVEAVPDLDAAVAEAEAHAQRTARALAAMGCATTAQARASGVSPDQWDPLIVLSALEPENPALVERLTALAAQPNRAVGVVVPSLAGHLPGRRLAVQDDGSLSIAGADVEAWPRRLEPGDASDLVSLLGTAGVLADVARDPDTPAGAGVRRPATGSAGNGPDPRLDDELELGRPETLDLGRPEMEEIELDPLAAFADDGDDGDDPADVLDAGPDLGGESGSTPEEERTDREADEGGALVSYGRPGTGVAEAQSGAGDLVPADDLGALLGEVDVLVRVLGEVEAVRLDHSVGGAGALGSPEPAETPLTPTRQKGLEAVTYLALREAVVEREDLEAALFPNGAGAAKTIYNTVSSARTLVGDDLFPPSDGGRYELSERVVTDYGLFCELVAQADETDDAARAADRLAGALSLVRGEPFVGVGRGYAWVGAHRGMIVAQVIDAADELAEIRLALGDWRAAEWAARQGLRAFPADERMYRLLMRTARAAGNLPGVQRAFRELCDVIADPAVGVEPEDTLHPETVALFEELTGGSARARS